MATSYCSSRNSKGQKQSKKEERQEKEMTIEQLEQLAFKGEPMPSELSLPEMTYYVGLIYIYSAYKLPNTNKTELKAYKEQIREKFEAEQKLYEEQESNLKAQRSFAEIVKELQALFDNCISNADNCPVCAKVKEWDNS